VREERDRQILISSLFLSIYLSCLPIYIWIAMSWHGNRLVDVKREHESDFSINIDAVINAAKSEEAKMVFLASPNNPDGGMICDDDLKRLLELDCLVVLDEAYIEFSESPSKLPWALNYDNLVVLRTFRCVSWTLSLHFLPAHC